MPELPEVETVRQGLNQLTLYQDLVGGEVLFKRTIAYPLSVSTFLTGLTGSAIAQWHRRGKYLLAELVHQETGSSLPIGVESASQEVLSNRQDTCSTNLQAVNGQRSTVNSQPLTAQKGWLGVHLRMTGQLLWVDRDEPLQKHTRVRLFFADNRELRFVDQRTFGQMWWVPKGVEVSEVVTGLQRLGPEPFSEEFSVQYFTQRLRQTQRTIKNALLDQRVVAGVGNIYADEALFLSGIHPMTLCKHLTPQQIQRLHSHLIAVLQQAIASGGSTIRNFLNVQGVNGNYSGQAWVYQRSGEPCRVCQTPIQRLKIGGRSAHFCPQCQ